MLLGEVLLAEGAAVVLEAVELWSVVLVLEVVELLGAVLLGEVLLAEGAAVVLEAVELWSVVLVLEVVELLALDVLGRRSLGRRRVRELQARVRDVVWFFGDDHDDRRDGKRDDDDDSREQPAPQRPTRKEPRHDGPW